ncbi:MAG: tryptophan 7-halogenase [Candidatus Margulisbacteria bacterium]|nr:tryptophan 7-halogenase [Candidatus Margulisiibacteriota bacterium]
MKKLHCDVVILGSGISSTIQGMILAKSGLSVILLEKGSHPKFTIGESTVPQTSLMMSVLATRYGVPEIAHLQSFQSVKTHISPSSGIKKNIGFVYHHKSKPVSCKEFNQTSVGSKFHAECHLFRQDIDVYMLQTAIRYGCKVFQNTRINNINIHDQGIRVSTNNFNVSAQYIIDGTGHSSLVAQLLNLRDKPCTLETHSRSIFTHMIDVKSFDSCVAKNCMAPSPWNQGTLHHLFDGGWLWVIPFNNHETANNHLISVGLTLDTRKFPKSADISPEEEFYKIIQGYPDIIKQFSNAKPVREWVSTDRIQYTSKKCVGARFCLLSHSTGFVDPFFSRGLYNTLETINSLSRTLLNAFKNNTFSDTHFNSVEVLQQGLISWNDKLVDGAYISFSSFKLWNAWLRIWLLSSSYGVLRIINALAKYSETKDIQFLESLDTMDIPGAMAPNSINIMDLFSNAYNVIKKVESDQSSIDEASKYIFSMLLSSERYAIPIFPFQHEDKHVADIRPIAHLKLLYWMKFQAPIRVRQKYLNFKLSTMKKVISG